MRLRYNKVSEVSNAAPRYRNLGFRSSTPTEFRKEEIIEGKRVTVRDKNSKTKQTWVTFYNAEATDAFEAFKPEHEDSDERAFQTSNSP